MSLANLLVVIFLVSASTGKVVYYATCTTRNSSYFISTVPETRAQQTVRCFNSDTCQRTEELAPMTIEDCCFNNPDGLSFQRFGSELCESCIGMCMSAPITTIS